MPAAGLLWMLSTIRRIRPTLAGCLVLAATAVPLGAADAPAFKHAADIVYGRKHGVALTMDVFRPTENAKGIAVIWVVSGGWVSNHALIAPRFAAAPIGRLVDRGYTVVAVTHGSQPKYTIPEILEDLHRAVRFLRTNASEYKIDPERIGIIGGSAGGHLSLMQGTAGTPGNAEAADPVERASSRVQAVACFFPPTDFLNYGKTGVNVFTSGILKDFRGPFDFQRLDKARGKFGQYVRITDEHEVLEICRKISPVDQVTPDDAPTLIFHGDADGLVPIQQSEVFVAKMKEAGVPVELVVRPGAGHGWLTLPEDYGGCADWFDKYLSAK